MSGRFTFIVPLVAALWGSALGAITLELPQPSALTGEEVTPGSSYPVPIAPWDGSEIKVFDHKGLVQKRVWRIEREDVSPQRLSDALVGQLQEADFDVIFTCIDAGCGGYDFRFATPAFGAPEMFIDLGDYVFTSANKGETFVTLFVSASTTAGYVQMIEVGPGGDRTKLRVSSKSVTAPVPLTDIAAALETSGRFILADLSFAVGSSSLAEGEYQSLEDVAQYLSDNPDATIALVGHTDSQGSLAGNIALSKKRAQSVRAFLVNQLGADGARIEAEGNGYLSPLATNLTSEGREVNRRVEVIITSTQ